MLILSGKLIGALHVEESEHEYAQWILAVEDEAGGVGGGYRRVHHVYVDPACFELVIDGLDEGWHVTAAGDMFGSLNYLEQSSEIEGFWLYADDVVLMQ